MSPDILDKIDKLITEKKIEEAQFNLSKLENSVLQGTSFDTPNSTAF